MDIPLTAITGVWEGYTPYCDYWSLGWIYPLLRLLEFGKDIPLAAIAGVWEGYTPCCDHIGDDSSRSYCSTC